jgi:hypothetical protein
MNGKCVSHFKHPGGAEQMRKLALFMGSLAITMAAGAVSSSALPFNTVYVDAYAGFDSATCGAAGQTPGTTAPCATLNQALQNSSPGGQIVVVRGNAFGPIYLTGSIAIIGPADSSFEIANSGAAPGCIGAAPGTCAASTTAGVEIVAGTSDVIKLKDVSISGGSSGTTALKVHSAFGVSLTGVKLRGGSSASLTSMMLVDSSQGSQVQIYLHNSDVGFSSFGGGISVAPTGATPIRMNINNSEVHNALFGLQAISTGLTGSANIQTLVDATQFFSFNNSAISVASSASANGAAVSLTRSAITNTGGAAFKANGAGASGILYESAITGNATGVSVVNGAGVFTYQNNEILFNGANCAPAACSTVLTAQPPS